MKKHPFALLPVLTCVFAAFTIGFFLGRNYNHETVQLTALPVTAAHNIPTETVSDVLPGSTEPVFPVDINTAPAEVLSELPGIGETIAERIIAYRELNGPFDRPEELMNVEGIGSGKLEAVLDYVITGGQTYENTGR